MWLEKCLFIQQIFITWLLCVDTVLGTRDLIILNKPENADASMSFTPEGERNKSKKEGSFSCDECYDRNKQHTMKEKSWQWVHSLVGCQRGLSSQVALNWSPERWEAVRLGEVRSLQSERQSQRSRGGRKEHGMLQEQTGNECGQALQNRKEGCEMKGRRHEKVFKVLIRKRVILCNGKPLNVFEWWKYMIWFTFSTITKPVLGNGLEGS